ncbi:hypothetical protein KUCAC02_029657, partial [Chaenocephalus aceratus]
FFCLFELGLFPGRLSVVFDTVKQPDYIVCQENTPMKDDDRGGERGGVWTSVEEKQNHSRTHRGASKEEELPAEDEEGPNGALGRYRAEPTIRDRLPTAVASCLGNWLKEKKQKK